MHYAAHLPFSIASVNFSSLSAIAIVVVWQLPCVSHAHLLCICLLVLRMPPNFHNEPPKTMHVHDIAPRAKNVIRYWNYRQTSHIRLFWKSKWDEASVTSAERERSKERRISRISCVRACTAHRRQPNEKWWAFRLANTIHAKYTHSHIQFTINIHAFWVRLLRSARPCLLNRNNNEAYANDNIKIIFACELHGTVKASSHRAAAEV